ncbi:MAG TPA: response regulator [Planctomycetota bacterium]|jgi:DNA-binding NtrC family response regulator
MTSDGLSWECGPSLLLVERDFQRAWALTSWLRWHVKTVVHVASAHDALVQMHGAAVVQTRFDGLLLDADLPDGSADQLMEAFHVMHRDRPVAVMAEGSDVKLELRCEVLGIHLFHKPFVAEELGSWIELVQAAMRTGENERVSRLQTARRRTTIHRYAALGARQAS